MPQETFNVVDDFVNRDAEIKFIHERCLEPLKGNKPINPQFVEFTGVWGIGKTAMLRRIEHDCSRENFHSIWIDANNSPDQLYKNIAEQVRDRYQITFTSRGDAFDKSFTAMQALQEKYDRAIVFIDALDEAEGEQLQCIKGILHRFIEIRKLLFIMASRKMIDFRDIATIKRKLVERSLSNFSRDNYVSYVKKLTQKLAEEDLKEEELTQIFQLTGGHPRAVDIAVKRVKQEKLDLTAEQGQRRLLHIISEQVIRQGILSRVYHDPDQLSWYQTMLSLFAIPRRFNLTIMQKMIERFAEQHKLNSSLGYMNLHRRINLGTGLLDWQEARTGYSMESPVRHLLLEISKMEDLDRYTQIHNFLMEQNWRLAMEVSGTDRIHYIQEYMYHSACSLSSDKVQENVDKAMNQITAASTESALQFQEEYQKDAELQEALGVQRDNVFAKIYTYFADSYWELALTALDGEERISYLRSYVFYNVKDPTRLSPFKLCMQRIREQKETSSSYHRLLEILAQDTEIKELLGDDPQAWNLE